MADVPARRGITVGTRSTRGISLTVVALATALVLTVACDDPPPPVSGASVDKEGNVKQAKKPPKKKPKPKALEAEEESLTDADFIEGPANRDPFRSFIHQFSKASKVAQVRQRPVKMKRYGLDEMKLMAIVSGRGTQATAMFRDPKGLGVTAKRGDYIGKSEAKVKQILKDKVLLELEEMMDGKPRKTERVIELHKKDRSEELNLD